MQAFPVSCGIALTLTAALLLTACGGPSEAEYHCMLRMQGDYAAQAIVAMYKRGELGTAAHLRQEVGTPAPFLDAQGRVIDYTTLTSGRQVDFDNRLLHLVSVNHQARFARNDAVARARIDSKTKC
jgi:hypothetical protein